MIRKEILENIKGDWKESFFKIEEKKEYFWRMINEIENEYSKARCWPEKDNIFRIFREISVRDIKVVILGQDPYHSPGVADGFAFSTRKERYMPASLKNIFHEIKSDLGIAKVKSDLTSWVRKGVFLVNTCFTVRNSSPLSHQYIWREFTNSLIEFLVKKNPKIVWVFWGNESKKLKEKFRISNEFSIVSAHPSPFSANYGFFGSKPFSKINAILVNNGINPIDWEFD